MVKPILKQIDILVFPSYGGNLELRTKEGARKFKQWVKQIELAGKRKDTALLIIPESLNERTVFKKGIDLALKEHLPNIHYMLDRESVWDHSLMKQDIMGIKHFLQNNFSLSAPVQIKAYGQHVPDACVGEYGGKLGKVLGEFLKSKGILVNERIANGLSVKYPGYYGVKLVEKRLGRELSPIEVIEMRKLIDSIYAKRKFAPASVAHALSRGTSVEGIRQNLSALKTRKTKVK